MPDKPLHIVLTTIFVPQVLYYYLNNFSRFGHLDDVKIWIVGDRKTPPRTADIAREITRKGLETVYLDIPAQDTWGARYPEFYRRLPLDNETRRNIGYLRALEDGCEVLICIDDDTYPGDVDFAGSHKKTGQKWTAPLTHVPEGFYNVCEHLDLQPRRPVWPRGFPFLSRLTANRPEQVQPSQNTKIGVNMGLWTGAPDLDALTWLNNPVESLAFTGEDTCLLTHKTWIPVNTQNTGFARELLPACLCVPMGWDLPGGKIERYGDIWSGFFLQAVLEGTDYHVAFGAPIVEHRRNPHDPLNDLRCECWGMMLTDWLVHLLQSEFSPQQTAIADRIKELSEFMKEKSADALPAWCPEEVRAFIDWTADTLSIWANLCEALV